MDCAGRPIGWDNARMVVKRFRTGRDIMRAGGSSCSQLHALLAGIRRILMPGNVGDVLMSRAGLRSRVFLTPPSGEQIVVPGTRDIHPLAGRPECVSQHISLWATRASATATCRSSARMGSSAIEPGSSGRLRTALSLRPASFIIGTKIHSMTVWIISKWSRGPSMLLSIPPLKECAQRNFSAWRLARGTVPTNLLGAVS